MKNNKKHKKRQRKKKLRRLKAIEKLNNNLTSGDKLMKNKAMKEFKTYIKVQEVNTDLGLVFGYGIICKKDDAHYVDHGEDHIPQDRMLKSVLNFMENSAIVDDMHDNGDHGSVIFSMPMTEEIAKAYNIQTDTYGWMVGVKPTPEILEKFASGEYTGFSIGGTLETFAEVDNIDEFYSDD
ncbi:MAG: hypothetical protein DRO67_09170 [Candidatus Asgardarchaeum californiense]|nr:MAG: hypothetical protein DRO67_09170 [Candidatus Asgardarchaeum californiense]